jgi:hypothetical protein
MQLRLEPKLNVCSEEKIRFLLFRWEAKRPRQVILNSNFMDIFWRMKSNPGNFRFSIMAF